MTLKELNQESPSGTAVARPAARIELPGSGASTADIEVVYQRRRTRLTRALIALAVSWLLIPLVFFIPPHFPWVIAMFLIGPILGWRLWQGQFVVKHFVASCPRCGHDLEVEPGSRIRAHQTLECYGCHRQPELVLHEPAD